MSELYESTGDQYEPQLYEIRIRGHLAERWIGFLGEKTIKLEDTGNTLLTVPVVDQAALHGLLRKVRDSGMTLLSVNAVDTDQAGGANVNN